MEVQRRKRIKGPPDQVNENIEISALIKKINPAQCAFPLKIYLKRNKIIPIRIMLRTFEAHTIPKPVSLDTIYINTGYPTGQIAKNDFPSGAV